MSTFITTNHKPRQGRTNTTALCKICGQQHNTNDMIKQQSTTNYFYICHYCNDRLLSNLNSGRTYSQENNTTHNKQASKGFTYSIEFEIPRTNYFNTNDINFMTKYNWLYTHDATVLAELKTPIYQSKAGIIKTLASIDKLTDWKHIIASNDTYGTHTNIGHIDHINANTISYINDYYYTLFRKFSNYLEDNTNATVRLFGRDFTYYANALSNGYSSQDHCNFINIQHNTHIEFRLVKFINATQYRKALQFCEGVVSTLINNFITHIEDDYTTKTYLKNGNKTTNFTSKDEYLTHKAVLTCNKLITLFKKTMNIID